MCLARTTSDRGPAQPLIYCRLPTGVLERAFSHNLQHIHVSSKLHEKMKASRNIKANPQKMKATLCFSVVILFLFRFK